jgi:hypothetical protein
MIARDLYRLKKEVELLEKEYASAPNNMKDEAADLLRKKKAELSRMKGILDGSKEPPKCRRPL